MGGNSFPFLKVWRNVCIKGYKKVPYQKMTGRHTILYSGKIICGCETKPDDFDDKKDLWIGCDCDYPKYKNLKKVFL